MATKKKPAKAPLFATISHEASSLQLPRYEPRLALILHSNDRHSMVSTTARQIMASVHDIGKVRHQFVLSPGRLLDRAEELVIANDLIRADPEPMKLELYPHGLLHLCHASVTWYLSPCVRPMRFRTGQGIKEFTVPWPALVCHAIGNALFVAALDRDTHPNLSQRAFHAPAGNIYADGKLCTGNIPPPRGPTAAHGAGVDSNLLRHSVQQYEPRRCARQIGTTGHRGILESPRRRHRFPVEGSQWPR